MQIIAPTKVFLQVKHSTEHCFIYKFNNRGNFIWRCPWSGQILEIRYWPETVIKGTKNFTPPPPLSPPSPSSIQSPFLSVFRRNKALYNFRKTGQHSIVERDIGLEYALLVASNSHISTALSNPLWKLWMTENVIYWQCHWSCPSKFWSIFFSDKISFFYLPTCGNKISNRKKCFFQKSWPAQQ